MKRILTAGLVVVALGATAAACGTSEQSKAQHQGTCDGIQSVYNVGRRVGDVNLMLDQMHDAEREHCPDPSGAK